MLLEQTELPRVSDAAARHTVDAAKAFKEFQRVRAALKEFEGSVHWKKVYQYEYLIHKKAGKQTYLGARDAETEAKFGDFVSHKRKLESRLKTLKETVDTYQRINKAVRAGFVPQPVVDVLCALDEAGLGNSSLVVGSQALYAYGQRSGLRVDAIKAPGDTMSVAEERRHHLLVLIDASPSETRKIDKVRHAVKSAAITPLPLPSCSKVALDVRYGKHEVRSPREQLVSREAWHHALPAAADLLAVHCKGFESTPPSVEDLLDVLEHAPKFEQVVIGRTGRMAMMRTLDPLLFVSLCERHLETSDESDEFERRKLQAKLVSRMLSDYLVTSKIEEEPGHGHLGRLENVLRAVRQSWACSAEREVLRPVLPAARP